MEDKNDVIVLTHKDFDILGPQAIRSLGATDVFSDVTLVASNGKGIKAHRAIIAMFSDTLQRILLNNLHPNPLIYCHDIKYDILKRIKDFIYLGEILVPYDHLSEFLRTGGQLGVHGLVEVETGDTPSEDNVNEEDSTRDKSSTNDDKTKKNNEDFPSHENEPGYNDALQETPKYFNSQGGESYKSSESAEVKLKNDILNKC